MVLAAELAKSLPLWWLGQILAIAIIAYFVLRWKPGFLGGKTIGGTMRNVLDSREAQIRQQLEAAQQSRDEAARIHEQSQADIDRAQQEARDIVTRAQQTSQAIQREIQERAREEYQRIVGQARVQIEYEREQAELALRRRAADIVIDAAREVVERSLDPQSDRRIIDNSLTNLGDLR